MKFLLTLKINFMMKKLLFIACICSFSFAANAQEEKESLTQPMSPELTALQTAGSLAKYGYATNSPTALIEAARIFGTTEVQEADFEEKITGEAPAEEKYSAVSFDPEQLLSDAKRLAGKDKTILALVKKTEKEISNMGSTRGAVGGAKYGEGRVYAKSYVDYYAKFWANELAEVIVIGDGDTDLDVYIYDENGNCIVSDTDYTDQCVCRWVPSWTGSFTIRIVNRGAVYNDFAIGTN